MSNAATPLGIQAMQELNSLNADKKTATNAMCMFVVINTASIQLIPATLIAMRSSIGSQMPTEIIVPIWITSTISLLAGVTVAKLLERKNGK